MVIDRPHHELEPGQLVVTTVRSHDQFNTTIYAWNDVYRGIHNERRVLMMNPDDMAERGLVAGDVMLDRYREAEVLFVETVATKRRVLKELDGLIYHPHGRSVRVVVDVDPI